MFVINIPYITVKVNCFVYKGLYEQTTGKNMKDRIVRDNPTFGATFREETGCGSAFFSIKFNWKNSVKLIEVFCGSSSKGGCSSNTKMVGRLVSTALQFGVPIEAIVDQLDSEVCPTARYRAGQDPEFKKTGNHSCSKALASAIRKTLNMQKFFEDHNDGLKEIFEGKIETLKLNVQEIAKEKLKEMDEEEQPDIEIKPGSTVEKAIKLGILPKPCTPCEEKKRKTGNSKEIDNARINGGICPDCKNKLQFQEGCVVCKACGFSKC